MADEIPTAGGNGAADQDSAPQAAAIAQYIKDLSVESPSSPQVFRWQEQPQLNVNFNINVENVDAEVHEVVLKIEVSARSQSGVHFLIDLSYGGLFALRNLPEEALSGFLLVEAPRLLFPFARQIIADATQQTGFPPLLLDPIDFTSAYMQQLQAAQAQAQAQAGSGEPNGSGLSAPAAGENEPGAQ
jgi:preprotein translocase subunit SecB